MRLAFRVNGVAQTKGSMRAFVPRGLGRPIITDTNRNLKVWQQLVAEAASHAIQDLPAAERGLVLDGVCLTIGFVFPRPKTMRPKRTPVHITRPDLDKCVRAIKDALSRVVYRDDGQIVDLHAHKRYADVAEVPHVDIRIEPAAGVVRAPMEAPLFAAGGPA